MFAVEWARRSLGSAHGKVVHSRRVRVLADHFAGMLPPAHSVLDVGSGDGLIDALVLEQRPDLQISGVDVLVRPTARIPVTPFDGERLPYSDRSWDSVLFCDVLHHTSQPVTLLREAARVARHRVIIKDHLVKGAFARTTLRLMDFVGNAPHGVALPYNYLTPDEWDRAYRSSGLTPQDVRADLRLYPAWADVVFGRSLHFIASCTIQRDPSS